MPQKGAESSDPLVSVVVPTYGRDTGFLHDALRSVFDQTYENLEVVVVDDGPEPVELVEDPRVPVRRIREGHDGVAAARNTGIDSADGTYIAFLDDDDRWRPEKIERQVAALDAGPPDVGVVVTGQAYVDETDAVIGRIEPSVRGEATVDVLLGRVNCATSTLLVRAEAAADTDGFDERFDAWEDMEWCLRLATSWEFRSVPEPLVLRRDGEYDQLTDNFEAMRDRAYPLFLRKHRDLAAQYGPVVERRMVAALSLILGGEGLEQGCYDDARRYLLRSIRHDPRLWTAYVYLILALGGRFTYEPAKYLKRLLAARGADPPRSSTGNSPR